MELRITNDKDNENYTKHFKNYSECNDWICNHLDLSKKWSVEDISGDELGSLIESLQQKYGVFTRMDFGETQKGLIIFENDKYKIEIFKKRG